MFKQLFESFFKWPFDTDRRCSLCRKESKLNALCWFNESISGIVCPELMGVPHNRGIHSYKYCEECINKHFEAHTAFDLGISTEEWRIMKQKCV